MRSPAGMLIRNDSMGLGYFKSPRGRRIHLGIDLVVTPGESIVAPEKCIVNRIGICYSDTSKFKLVELAGIFFTHKILYIMPLVNVNQIIEEGVIIGMAQDIRDYYDPGMIAHIHWEAIASGVNKSGESLDVWVDPLQVLQL